MLIYSMQLQQTQASNLIVLSLAQLSSGLYIVSMTGFPQKISLWSPLWHEFPQKNLLSHVPSLTWFPSRSYHCWWIWKLCYSLFYNRFAHTEGKKEDFVQKKLLETAQKVKNEIFLSNSRLKVFRLGVDFVLPLSQEEEEQEEEPSPKSIRRGCTRRLKFDT